MLELLGFGKSTITNNILGTDVTKTGDISEKNKRGKNTTTDISLYEIEEDTFLLDTPGFQMIDIFEIESKNLAGFFREFRDYIKKCEFTSCTHIKERNCGIKKALNSRNGDRRKIRKLRKNI